MMGSYSKSGFVRRLIFGLNIVETFHETSLQSIDIKSVIAADLVLSKHTVAKLE